MQHLSGIDTVFLHAETPTTPMNVIATVVLDGRGRPDLGYEAILQRIRERLPRMDAFRKRLLSTPLGLDRPVWVEDPDLDARDHVIRLAIPKPVRPDELEAAVARIARRPLDRSKPLWEAWVIEGLEDGRIALVTKVHHAVLDGVSGAALLLHLFDPVAEGSESTVALRDGSPPAPALPSRLARVARAAERTPERARRLAEASRCVGRGLARIARDRLADAISPREGSGLAAPRTSINGAISDERTVAYARTRLEPVARIREAFGGTVNDVVLAACTSALREQLLERGELPEAPLVAAIPVSTRRPCDAPGGNRISAMLADLPVHVEEPLHRYFEVCRAARQAKRSHRRLGHETLDAAAELCAGPLLGAALQLYSRLGVASLHPPIHNVVISNVPGPPVRLSLAGAAVEAVHPHGPVMDGTGLNITVMSYAGSLDVGILACRRAVPRAQPLADRVAAAVDELARLAEVELGIDQPLLRAVG
jgi:WS/DGAT/MGAT family acyltransferase